MAPSESLTMADMEFAKIAIRKFHSSGSRLCL